MIYKPNTESGQIDEMPHLFYSMFESAPITLKNRKTQRHREYRVLLMRTTNLLILNCFAPLWRKKIFRSGHMVRIVNNLFITDVEKSITFYTLAVLTLNILKHCKCSLN